MKELDTPCREGDERENALGLLEFTTGTYLGRWVGDEQDTTIWALVLKHHPFDKPKLLRKLPHPCIKSPGASPEKDYIESLMSTHVLKAGLVCLPLKEVQEFHVSSGW